MNGAFTAVLTLQSADFDRTAPFYAALGWTRHDLEPAVTDGEKVSLFHGDGITVSLVDAEAMNAARPPEGSFLPAGHGLQLAIRRPSRDEVEGIFAAALRAGARELRPLQTMPGGGVAGVLADLDGHVWEIGHDPLFAGDAAGRLKQRRPAVDASAERPEPCL